MRLFFYKLRYRFNIILKSGLENASLMTTVQLSFIDHFRDVKPIVKHLRHFQVDIRARAVPDIFW